MFDPRNIVLIRMVRLVFHVLGTDVPKMLLESKENNVCDHEQRMDGS